MVFACYEIVGMMQKRAQPLIMRLEERFILNDVHHRDDCLIMAAPLEHL